MAAGSKGGTPMSKWNEDALVALQRDLKKKLTMTELCDILEKPAGGFMSHAEALKVTELSGDSNQIGEIIKILRGKDDSDFAIFCDMLRKSNYGVWANKLELKAEAFKNGQGSPGEEQSRWDKPADDVKVLKQTLAVVTKAEEQSRVDKLEGEFKVMKSRMDKLEGEVKVLKSTPAVITKAEEQSRVDKLEGAVKVLKQKLAAITKAEDQSRVDKLEGELKVLKQTLAVVTKAEGARLTHISARVERLEQDMQALTSQANQRGNSAQTSESAMAKNVTDPNETPEAIQATYKLIVAVDIGTTYTKVAWCPTVTLPAEPIVHVFADGQWKDQVPTAVLYRPSQHRHRSLEFDSFGHEAICKFREEEQGWALFQRFKIDLHRRMDFDKYIQVSGYTQEGGAVTLPAVRVFCDILVHIKHIILEYLSMIHGTTFTKKDLKWVLTVPAMWMASARDVMRQAAREAKIYEIKKPRQLAIALEPESAALHVRSLRQEEYYKEQILNAKMYIVIDIEEDTIDIAVHKVCRHSVTGDEYIHEIKGCIGSDCGATCIDRAFEDFLCSLNVDGYPNFFQEMKQDPKLWNQLMYKFEASKTDYNGSRDMVIELPRRLFDSYVEKTSKDLSSVLSKGTSSKVFIPSASDYLYVSKDLCRSWYRPTVDSVVKQVQSLHKEYKVNALFVVGGFAECVILKEELKAKFPDLLLVIPPVPGLAVIKGAVWYGPHPKAIASRHSHATYGVACSTAFTEGTHDGSKKFWCERYGRYNCNDIFSVFVKIGDEVNPARPYKQSFNTLRPSTKDMTMDIYATDEENPMYVTDPGCKRIGTMTIPVEPLPAGVEAKDDHREVTVQMDFSGSEIFVSSVDDSGKHCEERTLDFLPVKEYM